MLAPVCVPARCCGPSDSANGGYVSGSIAHEVGGTRGRAFTVTLRQPPPLDAPMHLEAVGTGWSLTFGGALVAEARWSEAAVEPVEGVPLDVARAARGTRFVAAEHHPFPDCFGCGDVEGGLHVQPGPAAAYDGDTRLASDWTPAQNLFADYHEYADPALRASLAATWTALDCIGGFAGGMLDGPVLLGTMTAVVDDLPVIGEPHVVVADHRGDEGRKVFTAATLYDADGRIVGRAEHVWVRLRR